MKILTPSLVCGWQLAVALSFGACRTQAADAGTSSRSIAVVHTWGELFSQKPVTLGTGGDKPGMRPVCHIGIDCSHTSLYGGAVLYCLVEGESTFVERGDCLGPLFVDADTPEGHIDFGTNVHYDIKGADAPRYFFMRVISFCKPGEYTIHLRESPGISSPILATAKVTVTKDQAPLWSPWTKLRGGDSGGFSVGISAEDAALPFIDGSDPFPIKEMPGAGIPLPQLFPSDPAPGMSLGIRGNLLSVKFDKPVPMPDIYNHMFLARWWVNGKPFTPKFASASPTEAYDWLGGTMDSAVDFQIDFDPKTLGVKKGDLIAVQMLYCPDGFTRLERDFDDPSHVSSDAFAPYGSPAAGFHGKAPGVEISRLSPRIEFTYTGNPASMQAAK